MAARIIDGVEIARRVRAEWKLRADGLKAAGVTPRNALTYFAGDLRGRNRAGS